MLVAELQPAVESKTLLLHYNRFTAPWSLSGTTRVSPEPVPER